MNTRALFFVTLLSAAVSIAHANCTHVDFLHDLGMRESNLDPAARNPFGFIGMFQMGEAALHDAGFYRGDGTRTNDWIGSWTGLGGINSLSDFQSHPDAQVQAIVAYHNLLLAQIRLAGLGRSVGSMVAGVPITLSGLVAGAHLVGIANLRAFIDSSGTAVPRDGNGVPITRYVAELGGCDLGATAPSVAAVIAAEGNAGVAVVPTPPPSAGVPAAPAPHGWDSSTAFSIASGQQPNEVRGAIAAVAASLLTLWLAWTAQATFVAWSKRRTSLFSMQANIVRGCVLLCVLLVILQ